MVARGDVAALTTGTIFDIKRFSLHDGPGIRTTVFFKGCPLRCRWCHNPEGLAAQPELILHMNRCIRCDACLAACTHGAISRNGDGISTDAEMCVLCGACVEVCYAEARQIVGRKMAAADLMSEIERDRPFYDESGGGVTFSGGEPLLQWDFLLALLRACTLKEIHTVVDTCGFAPWEAFDQIRKHVDLFLYDLKLVDDARHRQATGASNQLILSNLEALSRERHEIVVRVPLVPGVNDDDANIGQTGAFLAELPRLERVDILPYHSMGGEKYQRLRKAYDLSEVRPPSAERVAEVAAALRQFGLPVSVDGD